MITAFNRQQTRPIKKSSSLKPRSRRSKSHGQASLSNYPAVNALLAEYTRQFYTPGLHIVRC